MSKFVITGGKQLSGEIQVQGSKNAMFPILAASIMTTETCVIGNVPDITDRTVMIGLLHDLGVNVEVSDHTLTINAAKLVKNQLHTELASKVRGSIVLLGALLGRQKKATMCFPGGDVIGKRPIEAHLAVFRELGAEVESNAQVELTAEKLHGAKILMEESSVTATENAILACVLAEGASEIRLAAIEPHVQQLCEFLNLMGAKISGIGTTTLKIQGVAALHGAQIDLIPDSNEAASLLTLAAATKSNLKISKLNPDFLDDLLLKFRKMNINFVVGPDFIQIFPPNGSYLGAKIQSGLYPKFASDDMPTMSVLATQAEGESIIHEWMYEKRQGYVKELAKMGANISIIDNDRVKIIGPTPLKCAKMTSLDIRMGMTMVIAALVAEGTSELDGVEHIDRGYEHLEERLAKLGAEIKRVE